MSMGVQLDYWCGNAIFIGQRAVNKNPIFLCYGDPLIYRFPFDQHRKNVMPNSVHVLCAYHLVTKGLKNNPTKIIRVGSRKST
jgi:hypothetical protein